MSEPVRLLAIPISGRQTASSRLRLYSLLDGLPDRFATTALRPRDDADLHRHDPAQFDLVYVQKEAGASVVEFCRRAVGGGVPVIYDIDDDFGCWPGMAEAAMCDLATTVTVDSAARAMEVRDGTRGNPVVLPCMIDAAADPGRAVRPFRQRISTVASFGNALSLRHTLPYLAAVPPEFDTYVVGPADAGDELPGTRLVAFRRDTFVADLTAADVFVLAHGEREAPLKDNNRLVMAMSLGLPSLVSPSPAYLEVLDDIGLRWLACRPDEIRPRLAALAAPAVRDEIGRAGYAYAWANYSPQRCVARFTDVLDASLAPTR